MTFLMNLPPVRRFSISALAFPGDTNEYTGSLTVNTQR